MRPRALAALLATAACLALTACGDEEDGPSGGDVDAATESTVPTGIGPEPTSSEPGIDRTCGGIAGSGASIFEIRAANIDCLDAKIVAGGWQRMCEGEDCTVIGWECSRVILGPEEMEVTCRREGGLVRFVYGV